MERALLIVLLGLLGYMLFLIFQPFLVPLAWSVVLILVFFPVHRRIRNHISNQDLAALVTTLLLTAIIIAPTLVVLGAVTAQAVQLAQDIQADWEQGQLPLARLWQWIPIERGLAWLKEHNISEQQVRDYITHNVEWLAGFLAAQTGRLAANIVFFFLDLLVTLFAAFYLFRDGPALMERLRQILPLDEAHREGLFYVAYNVLYASVISSLIVAVVQGVVGGLLFWMLGIRAPLFWGLVMAFLALLPMLGPWLVWAPAAIYFVANGAYFKAGILLVLGTIVVSGVDNVLRPMLISGRAQMNGLLVFIGILGGVAAFGMLGIVLGPILVALGDAVVEVYTTKTRAQAAPAS